MTERETALRRIRNAERIFIAYESGDLRMASDLRRRFRRMREGKPDDSVFLAAESLGVGADVTPALVESRLAESDLVVVACGVGTARSAFVQAEVAQALAQREAGKSSLLPIILKTGARLPSGLDFRVQAIHREVLFPGIRWSRHSMGALVVLLVGLSLGQLRARAVDGIDAELASPTMALTVPTDAGLVARLSGLRSRARSWGYVAAVRSIDATLARFASPEDRRSWLPPDSNRIALAVDPSGTFLWIGYRSRVELYNDSRQLVRTFDLRSFKPVSVKPGAWNAQGPPEERHPATLLRLQVDSRVEGAMAHVEYEGGAAKPGGWEHEGVGNEREVLWLMPDAKTMVSLGFEAALEWVNGRSPDGLDYGVGWVALKENAVLPAADLLDRLTARERSAIQRQTNGNMRDRLTVLARDQVNRSLLVEVSHNVAARADAEVDSLMAGATEYYVGVLNATGEFFRVTNRIVFHPRAGEFGATEGPPPFTGRMPTYTPAALDGAWVWLEGALMPLRKLPVEPERDEFMHYVKDQPESVFTAQADSTVRFVARGAKVAIHHPDASITVRDLTTEAKVRRFLKPADARALEIAPDGKSVFMLRADGAIDRWNLARFGEDGWITGRPTRQPQ